MAISIFGELTRDARSIVVMGVGPNHELAAAARHLEFLTPMINPKDGALVLPCSWPAAVQLATTFGRSWRPGPALQAWIARQIHDRMNPSTELIGALPEGLVPRHYQVDGACIIANTGRTLLWDEAGTGKTITTILGLRERAARGHDVLPIVVVCPAGVIDSWVRHIGLWAPAWSAKAWRGTPERRKKLPGLYDVYVTSYDTCRRDAPTTRGKNAPLMWIGAKSVVVDECHKIKNAGSKQSVAVRRLTDRCDNFVALSGTPITHSPKDAWPALKGLEPVGWPSQERWDLRYLLSFTPDYGTPTLEFNPGTEPEFRQTILGRYRRVAKADVLAELPPKVYSVREVEIPPAYRRAYDQMEADMRAEMPDGQELTEMWVLAQRNRLIQMAASACDITVTRETVIEDGIEIEKVHQHLHPRDPSWKVDELLEVIEERPGQPLVVFSPSKGLIELAGARCAAAGLRVGYVKGGQSARARTADIDAFQDGQLDVICVVTAAGGVGITLTRANTAVFLTRPYSLIDSSQSEDRVHRIGTTGDVVEIIDIVAVDTIESRVRDILRERGGQLSDFVQDPRVVRELLGGDHVTTTRHLQAVPA